MAASVCRDAAARQRQPRASVWFAAYPPSIITRPEESVLATLGDPALWQTLTAIGVKGVHTGPMKRSGGIRGREYTPSIDGNFDRISNDIDPAFGTLDEFLRMTANATANGAIVIDDIIPGHTGKGADFRLAELGYGDLPRHVPHGGNPAPRLGPAAAGGPRP